MFLTGIIYLASNGVDTITNMTNRNCSNLFKFVVSAYRNEEPKTDYHRQHHA